MVKSPGFFAVTGVRVAGPDRLGKTAPVQFTPDVGVPVRVYMCPACGHVVLRTAISDPEWTGGIG
jgi:hypothetical protein